MNFSSTGPSHRLQFFPNCCSVSPFHGVQSFRNRLQGHRSYQEPGPGWAPLSTGPQVLPGACSRVGSSRHRSTGPTRSLLQHRLPTGSQPPLSTSTRSGVGSSSGCRQISAPLWASMDCTATACLTMASTVCWGICTEFLQRRGAVSCLLPPFILANSWPPSERILVTSPGKARYKGLAVSRDTVSGGVSRCVSFCGVLLPLVLYYVSEWRQHELVRSTLTWCIGFSFHVRKNRNTLI